MKKQPTAHKTNNKSMDYVKIKRVKRNKKKVTTKEKILAGLGVGGTLLGGIGAVAPKANDTQFVRTNEQSASAGASKIKAAIGKVFGDVLGVPMAKADTGATATNLSGDINAATKADVTLTNPDGTTQTLTVDVLPSGAVYGTDGQVAGTPGSILENLSADQQAQIQSAIAAAVAAAAAPSSPVEPAAPANPPTAPANPSAPSSPGDSNPPATPSATVDTTGLTTTLDINSALQGTVTINGQQTTLDVLPNGDFFDTNGQDVTQNLINSGVDVSALRTAFTNAPQTPSAPAQPGNAPGSPASPAAPTTPTINTANLTTTQDINNALTGSVSSSLSITLGGVTYAPGQNIPLSVISSSAPTSAGEIYDSNGNDITQDLINAGVDVSALRAAYANAPQTPSAGTSGTTTNNIGDTQADPNGGPAQIWNGTSWVTEGGSSGMQVLLSIAQNGSRSLTPYEQDLFNSYYANGQNASTIPSSFGSSTQYAVDLGLGNGTNADGSTYTTKVGYNNITYNLVNGQWVAQTVTATSHIIGDTQADPNGGPAQIWNGTSWVTEGGSSGMQVLLSIAQNGSRSLTPYEQDLFNSYYANGQNASTIPSSFGSSTQYAVDLGLGNGTNADGSTYTTQVGSNGTTYNLVNGQWVAQTTTAPTTPVTLTLQNINSVTFDGSQSMINQLTSMQSQILPNLNNYTTVTPGSALAYMMGLGSGSGMSSGQIVTASDGQTLYKYTTGSNGNPVFVLSATSAQASALPTVSTLNSTQYNGSILTDTQIDALKSQITSAQLASFQAQGVNPGSVLAYMLGLGDSTSTTTLKGTDGNTYYLVGGVWTLSATKTPSATDTTPYTVFDNIVNDSKGMLAYVGTDAAGNAINGNVTIVQNSDGSYTAYDASDNKINNFSQATAQAIAGIGKTAGLSFGSLGSGAGSVKIANSNPADGSSLGVGNSSVITATGLAPNTPVYAVDASGGVIYLGLSNSSGSISYTSSAITSGQTGNWTITVMTGPTPASGTTAGSVVHPANLTGYTQVGQPVSFTVSTQAATASITSFTPTFLNNVTESNTLGLPATSLNPQYFLSDASAAQLASLVGGTVVSQTAWTNAQGSPFNVPNANFIKMPDGTTVNAGQLAAIFTHGYNATEVNQQLSEMLGSTYSGSTGNQQLTTLATQQQAALGYTASGSVATSSKPTITVTNSNPAYGSNLAVGNTSITTITGLTPGQPVYAVDAQGGQIYLGTPTGTTLTYQSTVIGSNQTGNWTLTVYQGGTAQTATAGSVVNVSTSGMTNVGSVSFTVQAQNSAPTSSITSFVPVFLNNVLETNTLGVPPTTLNPQYFLSDASAAQLAQLVGGTVVSQPAWVSSSGSPFNVPNANFIKMPDGTLVNAGQLAANFTHGYPAATVNQDISEMLGPTYTGSTANQQLTTLGQQQIAALGYNTTTTGTTGGSGTTTTGPTVSNSVTGLSFVNLTSGNTSVLAVGDNWQIIVTGPVGGYVYGTATKNGDAPSTTLFGIIQAPASNPSATTGTLVITGQISKADLASDGVSNGVWAETWSVGSSQSTATVIGNLNFTTVLSRGTTTTNTTTGTVTGAAAIGSLSNVSVNTGSTLTIYGSNFNSTAGSNAVIFSQNNVTLGTAYASAETANSITITVPANLLSGVYQIAVANSPALMSQLSNSFYLVVTNPSQAASTVAASVSAATVSAAAAAAASAAASSATGTTAASTGTSSAGSTSTSTGTSSGSATTTNNGFSINSPSLTSDLIVGTSYQYQFSASGGSGSYTYSLASGTIPPGMALASSGLLYGTPTLAGVYTFYVTASDLGTGQSVTSSSITIEVDNQATTSGTTAGTTSTSGSSSGGSIVAGVTPFFTTINPPTGYIGQSYSSQIQAVSNYTMTYNLISGTLPYGLNFSTNGIISGTPTAAGTFNFVVQAVTSQGVSSTKMFTITISSTSGGGTTYYNNNGGQVAGATVFQGLQMPDGYPASGSSAVQSANITTANQGTYTVKKGDTLFSIAQKVYGKGNGKQWRNILSANPNCLRIPGNTKTLKIGAVLTIPSL